MPQDPKPLPNPFVSAPIKTAIPSAASRVHRPPTLSVKFDSLNASLNGAGRRSAVIHGRLALPSPANAKSTFRMIVMGYAHLPKGAEGVIMTSIASEQKTMRLTAGDDEPHIMIEWEITGDMPPALSGITEITLLLVVGITSTSERGSTVHIDSCDFAVA